jgi:hypothetical protein
LTSGCKETLIQSLRLLLTVLDDGRNRLFAHFKKAQERAKKAREEISGQPQVRAERMDAGIAFATVGKVNIYAENAA